MVNKIKRIFQVGMLGLGFSFIVNCAAFDGPSCELTGHITCMDLMSIDADSAAAFETDCNLSISGISVGTYNATPCDTELYNIAGHCEVSGTSYDYALFYSSNYFTATTAESSCTLVPGSTWVQ